MNEIELSYSKLSAFDIHGPSSLIEKKNISNDGISHGSLVDILIVDRLLNLNKINENYAIKKFEKPQNHHGLLAEDILQRYESIPDESTILNIIKNLNLFGNTKKEELLLNKIREENFIGYLQETFENRNKIMITPDEYIAAKDDVECLLNHPTTKNFFKTSDKISIFLQVPFKAKKGGFKYKGIVDLLKIEEIAEDTIEVELADIKTGTPKNEKFEESFYKYRYYIQSSLYQEFVREILKKVYNVENKKIILKNFKFIYKCKTENVPIVWEISEKLHVAGWKGFYNYKFYKYKGIEELQEEIKFHLDNNLFEYSKNYYLNNGTLLLNDDNIELND